MIASMTEEMGEEYVAENASKISTYFEKLKKDVVRKMVLDTGKEVGWKNLD